MTIQTQLKIKGREPLEPQEVEEVVKFLDSIMCFLEGIDIYDYPQAIVPFRHIRKTIDGLD